MIFYSRENGRDGERDYIDTEDFKDVYFEKEKFTYLKNGENFNTNIEFELAYEPETNKVSLVGKLKDDNYDLLESIEVDPVLIIEQGAIAYYEEELLDNIEVISQAKSTILNGIKSNLIANGCLLKGTNLDVMGIIVNNHNTIGVCDNITIVDEKNIKAKMFYSVVNISTIMSGTISVFISDNRKLVGEINSIKESNGELSIELSSSKVENTEDAVNYVNSSKFNNIEEYYEDRANFISVDSTPEADFEEFDDLF